METGVGRGEEVEQKEESSSNVVGGVVCDVGGERGG